jgi:hypothetical protein
VWPGARPQAAICDGCVAIAVALVAERRKPQGNPRTFEEGLNGGDVAEPIEL